MASGEVNANVVLGDPVTGDRIFVAQGTKPEVDVAKLLGDHLFDSEAKKAPAKSDTKK